MPVAIAHTVFCEGKVVIPTLDANILGSHDASECTFFFSGTGKKSAYAKWSKQSELTATLCRLMDKPETPSSHDIDVIESFVMSLYLVS